MTWAILFHIVLVAAKKVEENFGLYGTGEKNVEEN